jgi:hypothetical protein
MCLLDHKVVDSSYSCSGTEEEIESRDGQFVNIYPTHLDNLSDRHKVAVLVQTFPGIRPSELKWTLNKCKGRATLALDVLLDQIFLGGSGIRSQEPKAVTKSKLRPRPRNFTGIKPSVAVARQPKKSHNTARRFRSKGRIRLSIDRRPRPPFDHENVAPKSFVKKPLIKQSDHKSKASTRDLSKILNIHVGKRKDRRKDDGKARSMQQSKDKNGGEGGGGRW